MVDVDPFPPVSPYTVKVGELVSPTDYSYMVDTTGFLKCRTNPCYHFKWRFSGNGLTSFTKLLPPAPGDSWRSFYFIPELKPPVTWEGVLDGRALPPQSWFAGFADNASRHFTNAINPDTLIANFILEAIGTVKGIIKGLKDLSQRFVVALKTFFSKLKEVGDLWIAWNFAIKPFISDAKSIAKSLSKAEKRLKWLRQNNHKEVPITYRYVPYQGQLDKSLPTPCTELDKLRDEWGGFANWIGDPSETCWWELRNLETQVKGSANAVIRFDIPDEWLNHPNASAVVWASLMGLNNPAAIVWEATPWSWLIDWFIGYETRLLLLKAEIDLWPDAKILQQAHSISIKGRAEVWWSGPYDRNGQIQEIFLGYVDYNLYDRRPGAPDRGSHPVFTVPWEWYNASILAAIIRQKRRR